MEVAPAFADLDSDGDYDLLIGASNGVTCAYVNTAPNPEPIPEFSTIALPVAAVLGLLLVFSRHKRGKAD
jgi:hypothetical protein